MVCADDGDEIPQLTKTTNHGIMNHLNHRDVMNLFCTTSTTAKTAPPQPHDIVNAHQERSIEAVVLAQL
jgi:hypothetical protein